MPSSTLNRVTANPFGRVLFQAFQPVLHLARRIAHPGVPNELAVRQVEYRGRKFDLLHRRWDACDQLAIQQCFVDQQYDMPDGLQGDSVDRMYEAIVATGRKPLILDCGANIGASVLWFAARYPQAHIIAIEPASENFKLLRLNCREMDVDLREAAISAVDGRSILANPDGGAMSFRVQSDGSGSEVDLVSVETLLAGKPESMYVPFLMKVDIEGGEQSLFDGDVSAINRFPLIILEPHDWMLPGKLPSREFFRFHVQAGREFSMKHENVASIAVSDFFLKGISQDRASQPAVQRA